VKALPKKKRRDNVRSASAEKKDFLESPLMIRHEGNWSWFGFTCGRLIDGSCNIIRGERGWTLVERNKTQTIGGDPFPLDGGFFRYPEKMPTQIKEKKGEGVKRFIIT